MLKKFWNYGTYKPVQRIGLLIILLGLILSFAYSVKVNYWFYEGVKYYFFTVFERPPEFKYDGFYASYPYLIALGVLMTWFNPIFIRIFIFIGSWIYKNK